MIGRAGPPGRRELVLAAFGAMVVTSGYVALAAWHGALGAARNDDWAYYRLAFDFSDTGQLSFDPYTSTMLVGQVVMARPVVAVFGHQIVPLQLAVAALSTLTLWLSYVVIRDFLRPSWAAFCVGCLAVGPIWGSLSVSFMSDVPALALQVLALALALRALSGPTPRWSWLGASLVVCLGAFSVREYAVAAVVAILLTVLVRWRGSLRIVVAAVAAGIAWVVAAVALFVWRGSLVPDERMLGLRLAGGERADDIVVGLVTTTGFLLFPVVLALLGRGRFTVVVRWAPLFLGLVTFFAYAASGLDVSLLTGNYLRLGGSYSGTLSGTSPRVFSEGAWWALVAVANVATAMLLTFLVSRVVGWARRPRQRPPASTPVGVVLCLSFGGTTVLLTVAVCLATGGRPFDRYLVPAVPFLAAAALYAAGRSRRAGEATGRNSMATSARLKALAAVPLLAMGLVGLAQVDASATFDGAKWRLGQTVTDLGYPSATIDAGYEWWGLHQPEKVTYRRNPSPKYPFWVTDLFRNSHLCASGRFGGRPVTSVPYPGEIARVSERSLLGVEYTVYARTADRGCHR